MNLAEKISDAQLSVMKILWREKMPVSYATIRKELQRTTDWSKSTILTLVRRLAERGVISAEKRDVRYYTPNVTEAEYLRTEEQNMLDKLYGGSAKKFVAALCHRGQLSEADIDELKQYFRVEEQPGEQSDV
jgi:BlaI family penicillinase repressor